MYAMLWSMGMKGVKKTVETTTLIGARVYNRHHTMAWNISRILRKTEKRKRVSKSEVVRRALEEMHARLTAT